MLAGKYEGSITSEDLEALLDGLRSNVKHTDDWYRWVDEDEWNDAKVDKCLEMLEWLVSGQAAYHDVPVAGFPDLVSRVWRKKNRSEP